MITDAPSPTMQLVLAGEPTAIDLRALQGLWSAAQYLGLTAQTNRLIEFTDGVLEVLPRPTRTHQAISRLLFLLLLPLMQARGGTIFYAPLRLQVRPGKYREPDLLLLLDRTDPRNQEAFWLGADLVIEIVSPDDPSRDTQTKRADYAEAGISEYWIVDPLTATITVLQLKDRDYKEYGLFRRKEWTTSALLPEFRVAVDAVLDAE